MKRNNQHLMKLITHYDIILMALIFVIATLLFIKLTPVHKKSVEDMVIVQRKGVILLQLTDNDLKRTVYMILSLMEKLDILK